LPRTRHSDRAGFTLLEALVALTIILAFAAALGPLLFQARRITLNADGRVAAQLLLRALLADPLDPAGLDGLSRDGESAGLHWRIAAEPTTIEASFPALARPRGAALTSPDQQVKPDRPRNWVAYRVVASVSWAPGQVISAETVRLGTSE
jgi:prepilin-type N-terminal cleavage/methylation domain-containing protein